LAKTLFWIVLLAYCSVTSAREYQLVTLDYPPYAYEENGEVKGVAVEIVKEVFNRMGDKVKITVYPWKRSIELVKSGSADAIFTIYHTPERTQFLDYSSEVLVSQKTALFVAANSNLRFNGNLEELQNITFGVVLGVSYGEKFDSFVKNNKPQLSVAYDGTASMRALLEGRHNAVVSNVTGAKTILKKMGRQNEVKMLEPFLQDVTSYLAFSKTNKLSDIRLKFDKTLKQIKSEGVYDKILKKNI